MVVSLQNDGVDLLVSFLCVININIGLIHLQAKGEAYVVCMLVIVNCYTMSLR